MNTDMNNLKKHLIRHRYFFATILLTIILGASFIHKYPVLKLSDDEFHYIPQYNKPGTLIQKIKNLFPGNLHFGWFLPLNYSVYPFLSMEGLEDFYWSKKKRKSKQLYPYQIRRYFRKIGYFNLVLLVLSGFFIYLICLEIGLKNIYAALAVALVTLNVRVMVYIQGLWPEYLHYVFLLPGLYFFILYVGKRKIPYLVVSSFSLAYAAFTKGIIGHFYLILVIMLFLLNKDKIFSKKFLVTVIAFTLPYWGSVGIQKANNYKKHGHFSLSTNMWVNIEASVIPEEVIQQEGYKTVYDRYLLSCDDSGERERLSKKRVFEYVKSATLMEILSHQLYNYSRLMNHNLIATNYHKGRWGNASHFFVFARHISTFLSWFLFVLGISGAIISIRSGWKTVILIGYLGYYLSALFIVGFNARFFMQAIPLLAIASVITLTKLFQDNLK